MKIEGFASSLLFGGVVAVAVVSAQSLFAPIFGSGDVLALYLVSVLVAYTGLLGRDLRRGLRNGCVSLLGSVLVLAMANGTEGIAIGLTILLALVRSGMDSETRTPRGLMVEAVLGLGALAFASSLTGPGWLGSASALWGFALVQSLYFLAPGLRSASVGDGVGDPFERARERLLVLLEER